MHDFGWFVFPMISVRSLVPRFRSCVGSFVRSFVRSYVPCVCSIIWFDRWTVNPFVRSFASSFRSFVRFYRWFCSLVSFLSMIRFVRSFVRFLVAAVRTTNTDGSQNCAPGIVFVRERASARTRSRTIRQEGFIVFLDGIRTSDVPGTYTRSALSSFWCYSGASLCSVILTQPIGPTPTFSRRRKQLRRATSIRLV